MAATPNTAKASDHPRPTPTSREVESLEQVSKHPRPTTSGKRPAESDSSGERENKKQFTEDCTQALELTEKALKTLRMCLSTTKDHFEKKVADKTNKDVQHSLELALLRKEIRDSENELKASGSKIKVAIHQLEAANKSAIDASAAKEQADKRLKKEQDLHKKITTTLTTEVKDLKTKQTKLELENATLKRKNEVLSRKATKDRKQQEPRSEVVEAAKQVQKMIAGVPVQYMGPLGDALKNIDAAITRLDEPERGKEQVGTQLMVDEDHVS